MKHDLPSLDSLKVFEASARLMSFSKAADELCITKAAVSYQIRKLETELDCLLFRRSVRQVHLTDAGQDLLRGTQQVFTELGSVLQQIKPAEKQPDVLIGATTYVAMRWLSSRIALFNESHPEVAVLLQHTVNSDEFRLQDVDFVIRWDQLTGKLSTTRLLEMPMDLYPSCSPSLLGKLWSQQKRMKRSLMLTPACAEIPLLCEDRTFDLWRAWMGKRGDQLTNPRRIISDANVRTQAAIDGQGWTLADGLMQRELDSGLLVAPFKHRLSGYGYAIQSSSGRFLSRNARLLRDWLVEQGGVT